MQSMAQASKNIKTIEVEAYNINEILNDNFPHGIDLLSTDIEGYDLQILSAVNYQKFRPKVIKKP
ncbi:hypothetical protein NOVO_09450 (plasmid) [Rickettsiales bacterium Ac37b]|nr:hypothetical protein NOVO_09450 [Rickettsiales bacterium Ac37b]